MPKQGHKSVTIAIFRLERIEEYFDQHRKELRDKGIKSASSLISMWIDEKYFEASHQQRDTQGTRG